MVDFEAPIDSDYDLYKRGKRLFLPRSSDIVNYYAQSPISYQREMGQAAVGNDWLLTLGRDSFLVTEGTDFKLCGKALARWLNLELNSGLKLL